MRSYEVTLIHFRNLVDFFYPTQQYKADDVIAADYATDWEAKRPQIPSALKAVRVRANKQLAHLTAERINTTKFNFQMMSAELRTVISVFLACAPALSPKVVSELNKI
jgi:glucan biosynthesis protein